MGRLPVLIAATMLAASATVAHDTDQFTIEQACKHLVMDYAIYRDAGDAEAYANLFTEHGTLSLLGQTYRGRQAILERMQSAPPQTSMHLMSTVRIYPHDANNATGVSYAQVFLENGVFAEDAPTQGFLGVGAYHDRFVRTEEGWKIAERRFVRRFVQALPAHLEAGKNDAQ